MAQQELQKEFRQHFYTGYVEVELKQSLFN